MSAMTKSQNVVTWSLVDGSYCCFLQRKFKNHGPQRNSMIMTPSQQCKQAGLKSLVELSQISSVSTKTLQNWHKNKPVLFATLLKGAAK